MNVRRLYHRFLQSLGCGPLPIESAGIVVPELMRLFNPKTVADVGCGSGAWLAAFRNHGCQVYGYDRQWKRRKMRIPLHTFFEVDLNLGMLPRMKVDLTMCLEVAEHIKPGAADNLVLALTQLSEVVIFAAGIPLQGGNGHVNEQWQSYWATKFARYGYKPHDDFRLAFWGNPHVDPWYKQDTLIYATPDAAEKFNLTPATLLNVVHPATWTGISWMGLAKRLWHSQPAS